MKIPELDGSAFILPSTPTMNNTERIVVLNRIASRVIEARRGLHDSHLFTYRGKPIDVVWGCSGWAELTPNLRASLPMVI